MQQLCYNVIDEITVALNEDATNVATHFGHFISLNYHMLLSNSKHRQYAAVNTMYETYWKYRQIQK